MAKVKPLVFDYRGSLIPENGITSDQIQQLSPALESARDEILKTDVELFASQDNIPDEKQPLDAGFFEMPERILDEYQSNRPESELGRILDTGLSLSSARVAVRSKLLQHFGNSSQHWNLK